MTAMQWLVAELMRGPAWKPDRWTTQREKVCTRCKKKKTLEKFSFAGATCKSCQDELSQSYRKAREKR